MFSNPISIDKLRTNIRQDCDDSLVSLQVGYCDSRCSWVLCPSNNSNWCGANLANRDSRDWYQGCSCLFISSLTILQNSHAQKPSREQIRYFDFINKMINHASQIINLDPDSHPNHEHLLCASISTKFRYLAIWPIIYISGWYSLGHFEECIHFLSRDGEIKIPPVQGFIGSSVYIAAFQLCHCQVKRVICRNGYKYVLIKLKNLICKKNEISIKNQFIHRL